MEKASYLGMAGEHAAMSEFLYRGYNVAVPAVDIGDDAYIVEDRLGAMWRLQVKTSDTESRIATYQLSRRQLQDAKRNELFFMFLIRWDRRWRFLLVDRDRLLEIRNAFERADRSGRSGRRPSTESDALTLRIEWSATDAIGWGASFAEFLDRFPETFPAKPDEINAVDR